MLTKIYHLVIITIEVIFLVYAREFGKGGCFVPRYEFEPVVRLYR